MGQGLAGSQAGADLIMYFSGISELMAMNGHGAYVWSAYGITLFALLLLFWLPARRNRRFFRDQRRRQQLSRNKD